MNNFKFEGDEFYPTEEIVFNEIDEFFCKEIKNIIYGTCMQSYPRGHSDVKVIYEDGSVKHFSTNGYEMFYLCRRLKKDLPEHFQYMYQCPFTRKDD